MMNMSIACNVLQCQYNQQTEHYCTLEKINVSQMKNVKEGCVGCSSYHSK